MIRVVVSFCLLLCLPMGGAMAQSLSPDDFARGVPIDPVEGEALQVVLLPPAAYETITRKDLGDLRVFNASGEEVPHAVYLRGVATPILPQEHALPFFPLYARSDTPLGDLDVQVRRTPEGAIIEVSRRTARRDSPLRAYLVDASAVEEPLQALTFAWADTTADFLSNVTVETSDDLRTWRRWGAAAMLARLRFDDNALRRSEITLPAHKAPYLRITWTGDTPPLLSELTGTTVERSEVQRQWTQEELVPVDDHQYRFAFTGVLPVDRIAFALPQENTLARVTLRASNQPEGPWQTRYQGLVYRLTRQGQELTTPPLTVTPRRDDYWLLDVDPAGGGFGSSVPTLEVGWTPEYVLFIPRGDPPFTLAFGNPSVTTSAFDADDLLRLVPGEGAGLTDRTLATTGDIVELGGDARLQPAPEAIPWSQLLLWGTLVLGVLLLVGIAVRLIRQIDAERV